MAYVSPLGIAYYRHPAGNVLHGLLQRRRHDLVKVQRAGHDRGKLVEDGQRARAFRHPLLQQRVGLLQLLLHAKRETRS